MTIACGDSHTSTHGAFGSIALGVGTSQIRDILATQTIAISKPKVRLIEVSGTLSAGVTAKDIILKIIHGHWELTAELVMPMNMQDLLLKL